MSPFNGLPEEKEPEMSKITLGTLKERTPQELRTVAERDSRAVPAGVVRAPGSTAVWWPPARSATAAIATLRAHRRVQMLLAERAAQIRGPRSAACSDLAQLRRSGVVVFAGGRVDADRPDHRRSNPDGCRRPRLLS